LESIKSEKNEKSKSVNIELQNQLSSKIKQPIKPPNHSSDDLSEDDLSKLEERKSILDEKSISKNEDISENKPIENELMKSKSEMQSKRMNVYSSKKAKTRIFEDEDDNLSDFNQPKLSKFVKSTVMNKSRRRQLKYFFYCVIN
jgi:SMC interacting uncharacterized protein involved in chromosome segregation